MRALRRSFRVVAFIRQNRSDCGPLAAKHHARSASVKLSLEPDKGTDDCQIGEDNPEESCGVTWMKDCIGPATGNARQ